MNSQASQFVGMACLLSFLQLFSNYSNVWALLCYLLDIFCDKYQRCEDYFRLRSENVYSDAYLLKRHCRRDCPETETNFQY